MIWSFILSLKMKCIWRRCCFWKLFDFNQDKAGAPFLLSSIIIMHLKKWWKTETPKWFPDKKLRCIFPNLGQKLNEFWKNCIFATEVRSFLSAQKYLIFQLFLTIFCPIKSDLSGNIVSPQALGFQKLAKIDDFWHFWLTQNVNISRFAPNVECDFLGNFQTPWSHQLLSDT